jgi:hypothetical protein
VISQRRVAHRQEQLDVLADYLVADATKEIPSRGGLGASNLHKAAFVKGFGRCHLDGLPSQVAPFRPLPLGLWNGEVAWRAAVVDCRGLGCASPESGRLTAEVTPLLMSISRGVLPST